MSSRKSGSTSLPRVVLYYRNSTTAQEKSQERQASELEPYAQRKGWRVVEKIHDDGISGDEVLKRPGLQRLLRMVEAGQVDGIGLDDHDRLLRLDMLEMGELLSPLRRAGVWIESVAQGRFDYETMMGRLQMGLTSEAKHGELLAISRRALTGLLNKARVAGQPPLPPAPYGYRRVEDLDCPPDRNGRRRGRWVIDEAQANVLRTVIDWYIAGRGLGWITRELARRGVPSPKGSAFWSRSTIRRWFDNRAYVGDIVWGRHQVGKYHRMVKGEVVAVKDSARASKQPVEDCIVNEGRHEPIISRETWEALQRRSANNKAGVVIDDDGNVLRRVGGPTTPTCEPATYILSRVLVCGECGSWLSGRRGQYGSKRLGYVCGKYAGTAGEQCVRCEVFEDEAVRKVAACLRHLLSRDKLELIHARLRDRLRADNTASLLAGDRKRIAGIEARLSRLRKRLTEVSKDMIGEIEDAIRECRAEMDEARSLLEKHEAADPVGDLEKAIAAAMKAMSSLEHAISANDRLELRQAITGIVEKVTVQVGKYSTTTGKTRRRMVGMEISLRPETGMDILANMAHTPWGERQDGNIVLTIAC